MLVASDLLGQQEHGLDSQSVLVTIDCDDAYVESVNAAVEAQAQALPRAEILRKSLSQSFILKTRNVDEAFAFSNDYAPEHLLLYIEKAAQMVEKVENAGSVFVGPWSPVACVAFLPFPPRPLRTTDDQDIERSCGDYASGTNHTLRASSVPYRELPPREAD